MKQFLYNISPPGQRPSNGTVQAKSERASSYGRKVIGEHNIRAEQEWDSDTGKYTPKKG